MKASLQNYRQSPRKVRLVVKSVHGKSIEEARNILHFMPKRAAEPIRKLIESAVANAKANDKIDAADLVIKSIEVNKGIVLKRSMPRARGSAFPINKRTSHVLVTLAKKGEKKEKTVKAETKEMSAPKAEVKKPVKKVAVKKAVKKKAE